MDVNGGRVSFGHVAGYDPGGNADHGVAILTILDERVTGVEHRCMNTAEDVISWLSQFTDLCTLGVDTLAAWSTGQSGFRPADRWLRAHYPSVRASVVSPNGMYGSMALNGMSVLLALRAAMPNLPITETHPKVLYHALTEQKYNFQLNRDRMIAALSTWLGRPVAPDTEHEWDALLSAWAGFQHLSSRSWRDLHALPVSVGERVVFPCGPVVYVWPEQNS